MSKIGLDHPDRWLNLEYTKNLSQTVMSFFREKYFATQTLHSYTKRNEKIGRL